METRITVKAGQRFIQKQCFGKITWQVKRVFPDSVGNWHARMVDELDAKREKTIACSELRKPVNYCPVENGSIRKPHAPNLPVNAS